MKLPNAHLAVIEREKIVDYLLNPAHPDNAGKAPFFFALGFSRDEWQALAAALRKLAENTEVAKSMESPHGQKYVLDGRIESPSGKKPRPGRRMASPSILERSISPLCGLEEDSCETASLPSGSICGVNGGVNGRVAVTGRNR